MDTWPLLLALPVAFALHEAAHAYVAFLSGDGTAHELGRVSMNPFRHIDVVGTVALPLALFVVTGGAFCVAYAKPVPITPTRFRKLRIGLALTAAAGPLANAVTGLLAALTLRFLPWTPGLSAALVWFSLISLCMAVLNMLPVPPLDGSKVGQVLLSEAAAEWYLEHGVWGVPVLLTGWILALVFLRVDVLVLLFEVSSLEVFRIVSGL